MSKAVQTVIGMIIAFGIASGQQPADPPKPSITGTVTDPSGAVIVAAKVSLFRDSESVPVAITKTDDFGKFEFFSREDRVFRLVAEANLFNPTTVENIVIKQARSTEVPPIILQVAPQTGDGVEPNQVAPDPSESSKALVPGSNEPVKTTLCELKKEPERFNGKIVEFRATVRNAFEVSQLVDEACAARIWFTGPSTTQVTLGKPPEPKGRSVTLEDDETFRKMRDFLSKQYVPKDKSSFCIGCPLYQVTITAIGRFDHIERDPNTPIFKRQGFGHLNAFESQLVLQSVKDLEAQPIDTSLYEKKK